MKIAIIGAGPAGANCAYWAAKEGHEVILFERNKTLAHKPCGEAVFKEAFDYVPIKPEGSKWYLNYVHKAEIYFDNKLIIEVDTKPFEGFIVNKRMFLEELVNEAKNEGAKLKLGEEFNEKENYDLIIDAGGFASTYARRKGLPYHGYKLAPAIRGYGRSNKIKEDTLYFEVYSFGYAWIFPYGKNYCNFGIGGHTIFKEELLVNLKRFLKLFDIEMNSKLEGAGFPSYGPLEKLSIGNIRVAGDSAGMVMPISGEGIRFALYAGKICYKDDYEKLFSEKYGKNLKEGKKILDLWLSLNQDEQKELLKSLNPKILPRIFLEGYRPNLMEALKLVVKPNILKKTIKHFIK
jgi:flavin-dependent dehydrogenase